MEYPIILTGDKRSIYACEWNGDTHEIHTRESLKKQFAQTNLYDNEPSWWSFATSQNLTFSQVLDHLDAGEFDTITNDNMTITILKRAGV
jgi:hypothetical protein